MMKNDVIILELGGGHVFIILKALLWFLTFTFLWIVCFLCSAMSDLGSLNNQLC